VTVGANVNRGWAAEIEIVAILQIGLLDPPADALAGNIAAMAGRAFVDCRSSAAATTSDSVRRAMFTR